MEWVETTGKSVQEAKETALDELGVDEVDAEFEVLAEAQTGLFGRLRSEARVRARVRPTSPRPKEDRRDRRRRNNKSAGGTGSDAGDGTATAGAPAGGGDGRKPARAPKRPSASAPPSASAAPVSTAAGAATSAITETTEGSSSEATEPGDHPDSEGSANRSRRRRGRGRSRSGAPTPGGGSRDAGSASQSGDEDNFEDGDDLATKGTGVEVDLDRQAEVAVDFLKGLTGEFGLHATVQIAKPDEETVELQLTGADLGILIGPKGATLVALQNLTRTVVFNETGGNNGHIDVDVAGYRQKRTEALVRFATQIAGTVKESGERTALEPMSAIDRKIVHDTISDIDGVSTVSEGEEPRRRVVVLPG